VNDARGLAVTSDSAGCVAALDRTAESYLAFRADMGAQVNAAVEADPAAPLPHVMKGYLGMLLSNANALGMVDDCLNAARAAAQGNAREQLHLRALDAWRAARNTDAIAAWEAILAQWPADLIALRLAHFSNFWTQGNARGMRASVERILPAWSPAAPGYGYVLGMHSFGCEEAGDYALAERQGRAALDANPGDLWAVHAVAHVMEMQGRHDDGARWVAQHEARTDGATNFKFHLAWHRALFLLDGGKQDEVFQAYDRKVRDLSSPLVQAQPDLYIDVQNAASLLMRLELLGADVGGRWKELADRAERRIGDHVVVFTAPHWMMALAADGRFLKCAALLEAMREYGAQSGASEAEVVAKVAIPAAEAVLAHRRGEWNRAVDALFPVRREIVRLGGSHAQRDILWQFLTDAAVKGGRTDETRTLLAEVKASRPAGAQLPRFYRPM
jgi:hypothetical protein